MAVASVNGTFLTCIVAQVVHSKAILVHRGLMLLTRTTVPFTDTNLPESQQHQLTKLHICNIVMCQP